MVHTLKMGREPGPLGSLSLWPHGPSPWVDETALRGGESWCGRARGLLSGPRLPTSSCFRNVLLGVPGRGVTREENQGAQEWNTLKTLQKAHPPHRVPGGFLLVVASLPASWGPCRGQGLGLTPGWRGRAQGLGGSPRAMPPHVTSHLSEPVVALNSVGPHPLAVLWGL